MAIRTRAICDVCDKTEDVHGRGLPDYWRYVWMSYGKTSSDSEKVVASGDPLAVCNECHKGIPTLVGPWPIFISNIHHRKLINVLKRFFKGDKCEM